MKNFFSMLFGVVMLICSVSCSHESEVSAASRIIVSPALTRVSGLNFEKDDRMGLTITRASGKYVENAMMTYDGEFFSSSTLAWYTENDVALLTAYYPYQASGAPSTFDISLDQSTGCVSSDLLAAVKRDVTPTSAAVGMVFRHMMAAVNIAMINKTNTPVTEVRVGGTIPTATIDLAAHTAVAKPGVEMSEIKCYPVSIDHTYRVLVVPQTAALTFAVRTADGKIRSAKFTANSLLQGKSYDVGLVVEADVLIPKLSGEVADWEPGGELTPDLGGNGGGTPTDGTMICHETTYKTATYGSAIWMAENLRYVSTAEIGNGMWYPNGDSAVNHVEQYGMLYDFDTAARLCPEGWRIPSEADFIALLSILQPPFGRFVPLAGVYALTQGAFRQFDTYGYLMGTTPATVSGQCKYLYNYNDQLSIHAGYPTGNGVSVRYVKDIK